MMEMEIIKTGTQAYYSWIICVLCSDLNAGLRGVRHRPASQGLAYSQLIPQPQVDIWKEPEEKSGLIFSPFGKLRLSWIYLN